ncbi:MULTISPECIES: hypothetical protein [Dickeya]|uniref:Uncharacterized protein n=1 Tax=Dickeya aquatica TaxID=1401087 RepID=A0A375A6E2_9GAMM|nr:MULTISPECIES: hypothetical protein [Dickeya]SLM61624.1 hypothetical protein DAQ1742_00530 [Dickeya aquatica]
MKGYHIKEQYHRKSWVRSESTDTEVAALRYLPDLLNALALSMPVSPSVMTREIEGETFFDILYRCDFNARQNIHQIEKIFSEKEAFTPEWLSGADLALPVIASEQHPLDDRHYLLLGLDLFAASDALSLRTAAQGWADTHLTGKALSASQFLELKPQPVCLYAGVLHGHAGAALSRAQLTGWLERMLQLHGQPETTVVVLAPVADRTGFDGWFGLYRYPGADEAVLQWRPLSVLVAEPSFWLAMKHTGQAHNVYVSTMGAAAYSGNP